MAISISLMFGRMGSIAGSNITAVLLNNHCEAAFYLSGAITIGWSLIHSESTLFFKIIAIIYSFTAAGVLAFFIPNIHKHVKSLDDPDTRLSIVSFKGSVEKL